MRSLLVAIFTTALSLPAQQAPPRLDAAIANGQSTFHIGERIPLILTISGDKTQHVDARSYDRSGRLSGLDTYSISPATGWSDPLRDYFARCCFMGGGGFSTPSLEKPFALPSNLNEWVRFDQPGDYTLTVSTTRTGQPPAPTLLTAAPILLHIIPATPEWQRATLDRIQQILAAPPKQNPPTQADRQNAIADLRFLASPDAIALLASYIREGDDGAYMVPAILGLAGLPANLRDTALAAMNRLLDDPDFPVCAQFLWTMPTLQTSHLDTSPAQQRSRQLEDDRNRKAAWQAALASLPRKQGTALAVTAQTLLAYAPTPETKPQIAAILAPSFLSLPANQQTQALEYNWDALRSHAMISTLRSIVTSPNPAALQSAALHRWYQLEPDQALRQIVALVAVPNPSLQPRDLWFLPPNQTFPSAELLWSDALLHTTEDGLQTTLASLMTRFGAGASTTQIASLLTQSVGHAACAPQSAQLAYLVRFDPASAEPLLAQAIAARGNDHNACRHMTFTYIATFAHGPVLTRAAVAAIADPDPLVVADALEYLKQFGDASSLQPTLDRYLQWTQAWAGKAAELDGAVPHPNYEDHAERNLGQQLGAALLANQGWLPDPKLTATVLQHCLGKLMCQELHWLADRYSQPKVSVQVQHSGYSDMFSIAQFNSGDRTLFEAKLAQYPEGTEFLLLDTGVQDEDQRQFDAEIAALFAAHHMKLEIPTR